MSGNPSVSPAGFFGQIARIINGEIGGREAT
jgi:hypothetical protein